MDQGEYSAICTLGKTLGLVIEILVYAQSTYLSKVANYYRLNGTACLGTKVLGT